MLANWERKARRVALVLATCVAGPPIGVELTMLLTVSGT